MSIATNIKNIKPTISDKTLKNYLASYNVCRKHFEDISYYENPEEVLKFYTTRYINIKSRKTNLHAQALICKAQNKPKLAKSFEKYAKQIEMKLKNDKKKLIEKIIDKNIDPIKLIVEDKSLSSFNTIKDIFKKHEQKVLTFYNKTKTTYTIKQLKDIQQYAIMALYCNSFFEKELFKSKNPPRRLEYRYMKFVEGRVNKTTLNKDFNYLIKPQKKLNKYRLLFNVYKANAFKVHGQQQFLCGSKLEKILTIYLKTHNSMLLNNNLLFPQNMYNSKDDKVYNDFQWSKMVKKYFGVSVNQIRKAFVTETYSSPKLPQTIILERLAYKMGHTFKTAMTDYRKVEKKI